MRERRAPTAIADAATAVPIRRGRIQRAILFMVVGATLLVFAYHSTALSLALAAVLVALTVVLVRRDARSGAAVGLDLVPRRIAQLGAGAAGGAVPALLVVGLARLITPFH